MRQTISGLVAAIAIVVASAVPAMACGGGGLFESSCSPCGQSYSPCEQVYVAPAPVYSGCNTGCGGWAHERLPDPVQQYYYADQGPSYDGPGDFAPQPTYQESAVSGWGGYRHHHYGYHHGYESHHYAPHYYAPHHFYAHHDMRYGMPHHYGYREHVLRRYY